ncbi:MAG: hypothetical protein J5910_00970 [Lachnospiraceae bacterium]|nr:hypothetical protein [Lachnospiraceae bacterium]
MSELNNRKAFELLCAFCGSGGKAETLFGEDIKRLPERIGPFLNTDPFPSIHLEFPLLGEPFTDVTVLYRDIEAGMRIKSEAVGDTGSLLDWYADVCRKYPRICFGFELDSALDHKKAAFGFQPRESEELVRPFCKITGTVLQGEHYLRAAQKMPARWPLSYFGVYPGRDNAPFRVCGYYDRRELSSHDISPEKIRADLDTIGFRSYDATMLEQISKILSLEVNAIDFQFDICPDESFGDVFSLDVQLKEMGSAKVSEAFESGVSAEVMSILRSWGIADGRTSMIKKTSLSRGIKVMSENDGMIDYALICKPEWIKIRWKSCKLQPSKCYCLLYAGKL